MGNFSLMPGGGAGKGGATGKGAGGNAPKPSPVRLPLKMRRSGPLPRAMKKRMCDLLRTGRYTKTEVARAMGVCFATVDRALKSDPALMEAWQNNWMSTMEEVENAMIDRAIGCENHIAAQQAGEFILSHGYRDKYDDKIAIDAAVASLPKIVVPLAVPLRPVAEIPEQADAAPEVADAEIVVQPRVPDGGEGGADV